MGVAPLNSVITQDELADARQLARVMLRAAESATPGPWMRAAEAPGWDAPGFCGYDARHAGSTGSYYCTGPRVATQEQAELDEAFIVAARSMAPRLAEWVERMAAGLDKPKPTGDPGHLLALVEHAAFVAARVRSLAQPCPDPWELARAIEELTPEVRHLIGQRAETSSDLAGLAKRESTT